MALTTALIYYNLFSAVKIIKKPKDVTALESTLATFEVSVSHDTVPVKWLFKNVELKPSDKHKIVSERKVHKLVLQNVTPADAGEYVAVVGQLECKAKLFVESKDISNIVFVPIRYVLLSAVLEDLLGNKNCL